MATWEQMTPEEQKRYLHDQDAFRFALQHARSVLTNAVNLRDFKPAHPASIGTLQSFDAAMQESEFEVALYALAEIAKATRASEECWDAIDFAARAMSIAPNQYRD